MRVIAHGILGVVIGCPKVQMVRIDAQTIVVRALMQDPQSLRNSTTKKPPGEAVGRRGDLRCRMKRAIAIALFSAYPQPATWRLLDFFPESLGYRTPHFIMMSAQKPAGLSFDITIPRMISRINAGWRATATLAQTIGNLGRNHDRHRILRLFEGACSRLRSTRQPVQASGGQSVVISHALSRAPHRSMTVLGGQG